MSLFGPACHTSCTEETGASPIVDTQEAGPVLGASHPALQRSPNVRTLAPLVTPPAPSASAGD